MKLLILFIGLAVLNCCNAQSNRGEFATNINGLMYSEADMKQLRYIVDSLNLKFKTCPLSKAYYSCPQARVYYVSFQSEENDLQNIKNDILDKLSFNEVIQKHAAYIKSIDSSNILIQSSQAKNKDGEFYYLNGNPFNGYDTFYGDRQYSKLEQGFLKQWTFDYSAKGKNQKYNSINGYYFPEKLKQVLIPPDIASLIQYVDCMIDTNSVVFLTDKYNDGFYDHDTKSTNKSISKITEYIDKQLNKGIQSENPGYLDGELINFAVNNLNSDTKFKALLMQAVDECLSKKSSNNQLEYLAQKFGMYDKALLMKRSYRVMGSCSQDESPRLHARDIAILAAQSHSWDIFLRAHLDIMNDRFERASDGSYAWGNRKTYLKELEELNLNIVDLMLGLTLRAQNVADNHYSGTVWRLGWALSESKEKDRFEKSAISIMKNDHLDEFNRGLVFLLFHTYLTYLGEKEQMEKIDRLKNDIDSFPTFLRTSISKLKVRKRDD